MIISLKKLREPTKGYIIWNAREISKHILTGENIENKGCYMINSETFKTKWP